MKTNIVQKKDDKRQNRTKTDVSGHVKENEEMTQSQ